MKKAIDLIREYFGCSLTELKNLTALDRQQLASAIARERGLSPSECGFALIEY